MQLNFRYDNFNIAKMKKIISCENMNTLMIIVLSLGKERVDEIIGEKHFNHIDDKSSQRFERTHRIFKTVIMVRNTFKISR